jgi:TRAP-type transport system periplasmic protein
MKARRVLKRLSLIGLCLLCTAIFMTPVVHAAKTIRVATVALPETTIYQGLEKWQKVLKEQSKGKLEIKILGRAVMGGDREMIEGCRLNTLDAAVISGSVLATIIPQYFMVAMPYFFNDHKEANAYLDGAPGQKLLGMLNEKDIVGLGWST